MMGSLCWTWVASQGGLGVVNRRSWRLDGFAYFLPSRVPYFQIVDFEESYVLGKRHLVMGCRIVEVGRSAVELVVFVIDYLGFEIVHLMATDHIVVVWTVHIAPEGVGIAGTVTGRIAVVLTAHTALAVVGIVGSHKIVVVGSSASDLETAPLVLFPVVLLLEGHSVAVVDFHSCLVSCCSCYYRFHNHHRRSRCCFPCSQGQHGPTQYLTSVDD